MSTPVSEHPSGEDVTAQLPVLPAPPEPGRPAAVGPLAVAALSAAAELPLFLLWLVGAEAGVSLGFGPGWATMLPVLAFAVSGVAALGAARFSRSEAGRTALPLVAAVVIAGLCAGAALSPSLTVLALWILGVGAARGVSVATLPLLAARACRRPEQGWALHHAASFAGLAAAVAIAAGAEAAGLTWRPALLAAAVLNTAAGVGALRAVSRSRVPVGRPGSLGVGEGVRRLSLLPTLRAGLRGTAIAGALAFPLAVGAEGLLADSWMLHRSSRLAVLAAMWTAAAIGSGLVLLPTRGGEPRAAGPLWGARAALLGVCAGIAAVAMPVLGLAVAGLVVAAGGVAAGAVAATTGLQRVVDPELRPHAAALSALAANTGGVFLGISSIDTLDGRFGVDWALFGLVLLGVGLVKGLVEIAEAAPRDAAAAERAVEERRELERLRAGGAHTPLLSCRGLDFAYGQVQVLFGVDFKVDEGEMVALLGTNGAGKSTLLRMVSGVGLPSAGSIRFQGQEITYLDAERRVGMGITQVPGGKAVFPSMSVLDNLRVFGYCHGRDHKAVQAGIDATFEAFPRLHERRLQTAATLSGGEQQMLALGKAFILRPKLLLIDELSLGLAPIIVGQLLEMVRRINGEGTAVVLVEQSVNIALSLVQHAYFMEKGQIRFDGPAGELLERRDLLRSVFLEGVAGDGPAGGTAFHPAPAV